MDRPVAVDSPCPSIGLEPCPCASRHGVACVPDFDIRRHARCSIRASAAVIHNRQLGKFVRLIQLPFSAMPHLNIGAMIRLGNLARSVDRDNLVDLLREAISEADALPQDRTIAKRVSPAGLAIDARFDDGGVADAYCGRFHSSSSLRHAVACARIDVFTGRRFELELEWNDPAFQPAEFHRRLDAAGLRAAYPFQTGLWRVLDLRSGVGLQWCASMDTMPPWDASAPLRQHLHWMLQASQMRLAHAATLGLDNRGVVLFGRGGAGKSGTVLAGLAAGLSTVGDDYVALGNDPEPCARALFGMMKQDRQGLARISGLAERTTDLPLNWRGKVEFHPASYFPGATADEMSVKAAIVPRIADAKRPVLHPMRPQSVMLSLMTSNLHQFAGEPEDGMQFFGRFLKDMPCFQLDLSPDAVRNGDLLREFIEQLPT